MVALKTCYSWHKLDKVDTKGKNVEAPVVFDVDYYAKEKFQGHANGSLVAEASVWLWVSQWWKTLTQSFLAGYSAIAPVGGRRLRS